MNDTSPRVAALISNLFGFEEVHADQHLIKDLGLDYLDAQELHVELEQEFDLQIFSADYNKCLTVGDLVKLVTMLRDA